jgi:hypothetical protein
MLSKIKNKLTLKNKKEDENGNENNKTKKTLQESLMNSFSKTKEYLSKTNDDKVLAETVKDLNLLKDDLIILKKILNFNELTYKQPESLVNSAIKLLTTEEPPKEPTQEPSKEPPKDSKEEPPKDSKEEPPKDSKEEPPKDSKEEPPKEPTQEPSKDSKEEPTQEKPNGPTKEEQKAFLKKIKGENRGGSPNNKEDFNGLIIKVNKGMLGLSKKQELLNRPQNDKESLLVNYENLKTYFIKNYSFFYLNKDFSKIIIKNEKYETLIKDSKEWYSINIFKPQESNTETKTETNLKKTALVGGEQIKVDFETLVKIHNKEFIDLFYKYIEKIISKLNETILVKDPKENLKLLINNTKDITIELISEINGILNKYTDDSNINEFIDIVIRVLNISNSIVGILNVTKDEMYRFNIFYYLPGLLGFGGSNEETNKETNKENKEETKEDGSYLNYFTKNASNLGNNALNTVGNATSTVVNTVSDVTANTANTLSDVTANTANTLSDVTKNTVNTVSDVTANTVNTVGNTIDYINPLTSNNKENSNEEMIKRIDEEEKKLKELIEKLDGQTGGIEPEPEPESTNSSENIKIKEDFKYIKDIINILLNTVEKFKKSLIEFKKIENTEVKDLETNKSLLSGSYSTVINILDSIVMLLIIIPRLYYLSSKDETMKIEYEKIKEKMNKYIEIINNLKESVNQQLEIKIEYEQEKIKEITNNNLNDNINNDNINNDNINNGNNNNNNLKIIDEKYENKTILEIIIYLFSEKLNINIKKLDQINYTLKLLKIDGKDIKIQEDEIVKIKKEIDNEKKETYDKIELLLKSIEDLSGKIVPEIDVLNKDNFISKYVKKITNKKDEGNDNLNDKGNDNGNNKESDNGNNKGNNKTRKNKKGNKIKITTEIYSAPFINSKGYRIGDYRVKVDTDRLPYSAEDQAANYLYNLFKYAKDEGSSKKNSKIKINTVFDKKKKIISTFTPINYPNPEQEKFLKQERKFLQEENNKIKENLRSIQEELSGTSELPELHKNIEEKIKVELDNVNDSNMTDNEKQKKSQSILSTYLDVVNDFENNKDYIDVDDKQDEPEDEDEDKNKNKNKNDNLKISEDTKYVEDEPDIINVKKGGKKGKTIKKQKNKSNKYKKTMKNNKKIRLKKHKKIQKQKQKTMKVKK